MPRISRHQAFMQTAEVWAQRSTCFRRAVGAVLVEEGKNIVAVGYNGPPSGEPHCTGETCPIDSVCIRAVHAERNLLERSGVFQHKLPRLNLGLTIYTTESPCPSCARDIIASRAIDEVYYLNEYRLREGIDLLLKHRVKVFRMTPSGYVIDTHTGKLVEDIQ